MTAAGEAPAGPGPTPPSERIAVLDVWRGFALLGICVVNFVNANELYLPKAVADGLGTAGLDWRLGNLIAIFMGNKFNTIFTLLFGMGVAMMAQRLQDAGQPVDRILLRRMLALLVIGWLHFLLLYPGELLHIYALGGLALLVCRRLPQGWLLAGGLACAILGRLLYEERLFLGGAWPDAGTAGLLSGTAADPDAGAAARRQILATGTTLDLLVANATYALQAEGEVLRRVATGLYYFGRMLLGFVFWRSGAARWLLAASTGQVLRIGLAGLLVAGCAHLAVSIPGLGPVGEPRHFALNVLRQAGILVQGSAYLVGMLWLLRRLPQARWLRSLALTGRLSLTNYLLQSVAMVLLLYGPGLRLAGTIGVVVAALLGLLTFLAQAWWSTRYLKRHDQGPAERLWRQFTYGAGSTRANS